MSHKLHCILSIDDDEPTNFFVQMILEESGLAKHVKVLQSGSEALEYFRMSNQPGNEETHPFPDLVFLDINMPAMNGWEFLAEYKKLNISRKAIIVMLTTSLFPEDKIRAINMPEISGFEHKPLTTEMVTSVIEKYFVNL